MAFIRIVSTVLVTLLILMLLTVLAQGGSVPALADHVTPTPFGGDPSCAVQGFARELTFAGTSEVGDGSKSDDSITIQINSNDTQTAFDWSLTAASGTVGIDAVIVATVIRRNLYRYDPPTEATSDSGLKGPFDQAIIRISFCYDLDSATATPTATATDTPTATATLVSRTAPPLSGPPPTATPASQTLPIAGGPAPTGTPMRPTATAIRVTQAAPVVSAPAPSATRVTQASPVAGGPMPTALPRTGGGNNASGTLIVLTWLGLTGLAILVLRRPGAR